MARTETLAHTEMSQNWRQVMVRRTLLVVGLLIALILVGLAAHTLNLVGLIKAMHGM